MEIDTGIEKKSAGQNLKDPWVWAAILLFCILSFAAISFTQDDAFISLRYAQNMANGHGLRFNLDENPPVEGFTNFFWILIQAIPFYFRIDPVLYMKGVGFAAGIGLIFTCSLLLQRYTSSRNWMRIGVFLAAINVPVVVWTVSGMETVWFALCCIAAILTVPGIFSCSQRTAACTIWSLLAVLTRPDGVIVVVSIMLSMLLVAKKNQEVRTSLIRYATIILAAGAIYAGWKLYYFHDLIPNTFHAKVSSGAREELLNGLYYIKDWLFRWGWPLVALTVVALFKRVESKTWLLSIFSFLTLLYIAAVGGDFMRFHRFFVPLAVPMIVLSIGGLETMYQRFFRNGSRLSKTILGCLTICLALGYTASQAAAHYRHFFTLNLKNPIEEDSKRNQILGQWLKKALPPEYRIATFNIGRLGYYSRLHTIDTLGLTDREIAKKMHNEGSCGLGKEILKRAPEVLIPQIMTLHERQPTGWRSIFHGEWKDSRSSPGIATLLNFDGRASAKMIRCPNIVEKYRELYQKRRVSLKGFQFILYFHQKCLDQFSVSEQLHEN